MTAQVPPPRGAPVGVLVTRPEPEAAALADRLARLGYRPVVSPLLAYARADRLTQVDLDGVAAYAFTSAAGVRAAAEDAAPPRPAFAVGEKTAVAARAAGFGPVIVAAGTADGLADAIAAQPPAGPLLLPRGRDAAADLPALLRARGAPVEIRERAVYRAEAAERFAPEAAAALVEGAVAVALLLSARTADAFAAALARLPTPPARPLAALCLSAAVAAPLRDPAHLSSNSSTVGGRVVRALWVETPTLDAVISRLLAEFPPTTRVC